MSWKDPEVLAALVTSAGALAIAFYSAYTSGADQKNDQEFQEHQADRNREFDRGLQDQEIEAKRAAAIAEHYRWSREHALASSKMIFDVCMEVYTNKAATDLKGLLEGLEVDCRLGALIRASQPRPDGRVLGDGSPINGPTSDL